MEIPQVSLHLLREDMKFPEYSNLPATQQDFPFGYPLVSHPSTLVLVGCSGKITSADTQSHSLSQAQNLTSNKSIMIYLRIRKDSKLKKVDNNIRLEIPNFEVMVEGTQLQILHKFIYQLKDFMTLYSRSMANLK
jgi:hypothetical protein